jgi:hypothetical protein
VYLVTIDFDTGHAGVNDELLIETIVTNLPVLNWLGIYGCMNVSHDLAKEIPSMKPTLRVFVSNWEMRIEGTSKNVRLPKKLR